MTQPRSHAWPPGLHALAEVDERAWLDSWARGHINLDTLQPALPDRPQPALAGVHR